MMLIRVDAKRLLNLAVIAITATLLALAAAATPAHALLDSWPVGDGHEGAFTDPGANGVFNYSAAITTAAGAGTSTIVTGPVREGTKTGGTWANSVAQRQFEPGRLVMIIQTAGYPSASAPSGAQDPINLASNQIGQFEIARVGPLAGDASGSVAAGYTLKLTEPLANSYLASGAQVVAIPEFTTVTLGTANRLISANSWNGSSGGVTAFTANGAVSMANGTSFNADGDGFRGATLIGNAAGTNCIEYDAPNASAVPPIPARDGGKGEGIVQNVYGNNFRAMGNRANGAGGGNCENAGGGGGGNAGQGGQGGLSFDAGSEQWPVGGLGGQSLGYSPLDHAVLGGGGGAGDANNTQAGAGGAGGGILFVRAASLTGTGSLSANGAAGGNSGATGASDGAGGGGGGGVVYARFSSAAACTAVTATGGSGGLEQSDAGVHGPGGGGGGGYVYLQKASGTCASNANAGASGYTTKGTVGNQRGAGPSSPTDPSAIGQDQGPRSEGLAAPTAAVTVPAASQIVPITSNFSGTSTALSTIRVYIDGTYRGSTISDGSGNWVYTTSALNTDKDYTMYVIPVRLGIAGTPTATRTFHVDSTPPQAPTITTPNVDIRTNVATPTVGGVVQKTPGVPEVSATVQVYVDAAPVATATTNGSGQWTVSLPALTYGNHAITARATDTMNNTGPLSGTRNIFFDDIPATLTISSPTEGAFLGTKTPAFAYSANEVGTATCQVDAQTPVSCGPSSWTVPGGAISTDGPHSVTIRWTEQAGNITTVTRNFTVDTVAPAITIDSPNTDGTFVATSRPPIGFTVTDVNPSANSECRADSEAWASCTSPWTTGTLSDGTHTLWFRQTDKAGNVATASRSVVVDTTLPTVTISQPTSGGFTGPTPTINFTVNDTNPGTSFCQVDGSPEVACTDGFTWTPALGAGPRTLAIRHQDAAGNNGPTTSVNFNVDVIAPAVSIDSPTENQLINTDSPQVQFTITDANPSPSSSCQIDTGPIVPCTSPYVFTGLDQGARTLTITHTDKAGNYDPGASRAVRHFTVDSIAPLKPTFDTNPANPTNQTSATLTYTAAEPGVGHLECQLDELGWDNACANSATFTGLAAGEHSFFVRQVDDAGNVGAIATYNWVIDQTPPPAPNVSGPSGISGAPVENFSFYNAEQGVTFTCQLDANPAVSCNSGSFSTPNSPTLADGPHSFSVYSTDPAGNNSSLTTLNWTTNKAAFYIDNVTMPDPLSRFASGSITFSASYPGTFYCKLDAQPEATCTSPFAYGPLPDGGHTFSVYAKSGADQTTTVTRNWTIDATLPTITLTTPANAGTTGHTLTAAFSAADPGGGDISVSCKLDAAPTAPCDSDSTQALDNLSAGSHTLLVTVTDLAGNSASASSTWTVDRTPPVTTITTYPAEATNDPAATFEFSANKSPSTFECSLDGAAWATCTSPTSFTLGAEGIHTFRVRATAYGNVEPGPATYRWTYDTTAPAPPVITSDPRLLSTGTAILRGTNDAGDTVKLYFIGNPAVQGSAVVAPNGNWDITLSGVANGTYDICATATDPAGNVSACSSTVTLLVDNDDPTVSISSPAANALVNSALVEFSGSDATSQLRFECQAQDLTSGDEPAFELCAEPSYQPDLISGHEYTVTVRAVDELENTATAAVTFTFDNTAPHDLVITTPENGTHTNDQRPEIGGSVNAADAGAVVTVYSGSDQICQDTAALDGSWSCTPPADAPEGTYTLIARAEDAAGNVSPDSAPVTVTIDVTPPAVPAIVSPADGTQTHDQRPSISGTIDVADAGATVTVRNGGDVICDAIATGAGLWNCTPASNLAEGSYSLIAKASDAATNESGGSTAVGLTIDITPPAKPTISDPDDGTLTNNPRPAISGTAAQADAGATLTVSSGASSVCQTTIAGDGTWGCTPTTDLTEGEHELTASASDAAANVSVPSDPVSITVDLTAPSVPQITQPSDGTATNDQRPQVSGTIAGQDAGASVTVSDGPAQVCQTIAGVGGNWSCAPTSDLSEGTHTLTAKANDAAGNVSADSPPVALTIDITAPAKPVISTPADGTRTNNQKPPISGTAAIADAGAAITVSDGGGAVCSTTVAGDGTWGCTPGSNLSEGAHALTAVARDAAGNDSTASDAVTVTIDITAPAKPVISAPADGSNTADQRPPISGTAAQADAGATLTVSAGGNQVCQTTVGADGTWGCTPTAPFDEGNYTLTAVARDAAGNDSAPSDPVAITIDNVPFTVQITGHPPTLSNNSSPTFNFEATKKATFRCKLDTDAVYTACGSPTASMTGSQQIIVSSDGSRTFSVIANRVGDGDTTPATYTWTVDTTKPAIPVITTPASAAYTNNQKPTVSGSAEANSTVTVRDESDVLVCTATTSAGGSWSCTPTGSFSEGAHSVTARATDAATNTSDPSAPATSFTVDITPPVGTVVQQPGSGQNGAKPVFNIGANEPQTTFTCAIDGAGAAACGTPHTPAQDLSPGPHTLNVVFTDRAGNTSTQNLAFTATSAPAPPPPPAPPLDVASCFPNGLTITDLYPKGKRVTLTGFARSTFIGQQVLVYYKKGGKKPVGKGTVLDDGSFTVKFKAPSKKIWTKKSTTYRVKIGSVATRWTQLSRRMSTTSAWFQGGKLIVRGSVTKPLYPKAVATVMVRTGCNGPWTTAGTAKIKKSGSFSTQLTLDPNTRVVFVRVMAIVSSSPKKPRKFKTYSFVIPARTE